MMSLNRKIIVLAFVFTIESLMTGFIPVVDVQAIGIAFQQLNVMRIQLQQLRMELSIARSQLSTERSQLSTEKNQYHNMVQNTNTLHYFDWDKAKSTINQILSIQNQMRYYVEQAGSLKQYLNQFQDIEHYKSQPCFNGNACTQADLDSLNKNGRIGSTSQKRANDALFSAIENQQKLLESDAQHLENLQQTAQNADGQMKAIQYANLLASAQVNQLLQLRTVMLAGQNAQAVQRQQEINQQAQQQAATVQFMSTKPIKKSDQTKW
ncbi:MAG: conjugal transfer protein TrbJ [Endozoicomonas sp. (ex Botrylloides leachii)]|nr:conjugal transfer protein TrbJ [Endozoicomonas sp. (ex Botrylloides leachii)]